MTFHPCHLPDFIINKEIFSVFLRQTSPSVCLGKVNIFGKDVVSSFWITALPLPIPIDVMLPVALPNAIISLPFNYKSYIHVATYMIVFVLLIRAVSACQYVCHTEMSHGLLYSFRAECQIFLFRNHLYV
jgi:hypothetical protein